MDVVICGVENFRTWETFRVEENLYGELFAIRTSGGKAYRVIPLKDHHGRLIDENEFCKVAESMKGFDNADKVLFFIEAANKTKTAVPKEGAEEQKTQKEVDYIV